MQVKQEPDTSEADAKQDADQQHHDEELSDSDESEDEDDFEVMPPNTCIEACTSSRKRPLQYAAWSGVNMHIGMLRCYLHILPFSKKCTGTYQVAPATLLPRSRLNKPACLWQSGTSLHHAWNF